MTMAFMRMTTVETLVEETGGKMEEEGGKTVVEEEGLAVVAEEVDVVVEEEDVVDVVGAVDNKQY